MASIVDLGYGPLSPEGLDQLVASGQVEEYQEGEKTKFRRTGAGATGGLAGTTWSFGR